MEPIKSPCVQVCELDVSGLCRGCLRTRREIAVWASLSAEQRDLIMHALPERREKLV